jgi:AcrR family transcriptional regulator
VTGTTATEDRRRGRPRNEAVDDAVTAAALALVAEVGIEAFSVAEVCARTGIARTTVYRRYPTRDDLIQAALARINDDLETPDPSLSTRDRLVTSMTHMRHRPPSAVMSRVMEQLTGNRDPAMCALAFERIIAPRHRVLREIVTDGIARGELRADLDLDAVIAVVVGPILYLKTWSAAPSAAHVSVEDVVDLALAGLSR